MAKMDIHECYKKQKKLSTIQFVTELPDFFLLLVSAFFSRSLLVIMDLFDSFGELLKTSMTALLSKKLSKDLRFEYNYGIGKVEAISALLCESIIILAVIFSLVVSVYELIFPNKPSDLLIFVVGLKVIHVGADTFFLIKQRKLKKDYCGAITISSYAASIASLLFDSITLVSLLVVWIFRDNPIGGYITPVICMLIAVYLLLGCIRRIGTAVEELTDKTLPEETQLKILSVINRFYPRYSDFHALNSRRSGGVFIVDLHISFNEGTSFEEIASFKEDVQKGINEIFEGCVVNVIL